METYKDWKAAVWSASPYESNSTNLISILLFSGSQSSDRHLFTTHDHWFCFGFCSCRRMVWCKIIKRCYLMLFYNLAISANPWCKNLKYCFFLHTVRRSPLNTRSHCNAVGLCTAHYGASKARSRCGKVVKHFCITELRSWFRILFLGLWIKTNKQTKTWTIKRVLPRSIVVKNVKT